jgi:hypothetical protein
MSNFANPEAAQIWLDGDAFRAPENTPNPNQSKVEDFSPDAKNPLKSPGIDGDGEVTWEPFGGIEAGVDFAPEQKANDKTIWNYRGGIYDSYDDIRKDTGSFIAVDDNAATTKTRLRGGHIVKNGALYEEVMGDEEVIALTYLFRRGSKVKGIYIARAKLAEPAAFGRFNGTDLDGWTFKFNYLSIPRPFTITKPAEGIEVVDPGETPAPVEG